MNRLFPHIIALGVWIAVPCVHANGPTPKLLRTDMVWNAANHNAFTDLVWHNDRFVLAFREGVTHGVPHSSTQGGDLRILGSVDGLNWQSFALIEAPQFEDLRDAKLSITPDNRLMLTGAAAFTNATSERQSKVWFSDDGASWSAAQNIGEYNRWLWGTTWHDGKVYGVGYGPTPSPRDERTTRLYHSDDGVNFDILVSSLTGNSGLPGGGETALLFRADGTAVAFSRRDTDDFASLIGTSSGDFTEWTWHPVERTGGPELIELPGGRIVAAGRSLVGSARTTALYWVDPEAGTLSKFLTLPSGGDTSYPGMVWHNNRLWVSYYSSHEGKASIYVSQIAFDGDFTGDGAVNAADYSLWRDSLGRTGTMLAADGNGDAVVNDLDYGLWKANFGAISTGNGQLTLVNVPEPSSMALMGLSALLILVKC